MVVKSTYSQWGGQGKWSSHDQQGGHSKWATCSQWVVVSLLPVGWTEYVVNICSVEWVL